MRNPQTLNALTLIVGIVSAIVLLVVSNCVVIIYPGQAGVLSFLGKAQDGALLEGIHFKAPLVTNVDYYDLTIQKFEVPAESATKDLQNLSARFAINFKLDPQKIVDVRRKQGTLQNLVAKVIAPQTQEAFKIAAAKRTAEQAITQRRDLKQDFDDTLGRRLAKYDVDVIDTSVVDLKFSPEFAKAVEDKQISEQRAQRAVYVAEEAEQQAQADVNRARGKAEAQRLLAETLNADGGELVLEKEAIQAWRSGGSNMPRVLVMGDESGSVPFLLDLSDL